MSMTSLDLELYTENAFKITKAQLYASEQNDVVKLFLENLIIGVSFASLHFCGLVLLQ